MGPEEPTDKIARLSSGWDSHEFAAFGKTVRHRGVDADESLDRIRRCLAGSALDVGAGIRDFELAPLPDRPVPIWIGGRSRAALRRAAFRGDAWWPDAALSAAEVRSGFEEVDHLRQLNDLPPPVDRPLVRHIVMADDRASALRRAREYFSEIHADHLDRGNPMVEQAWTDINAWIGDRVLLGNPADIAGQVRFLRETVGITELVLKIGSDLGTAGVPGEEQLCAMAQLRTC